MNRENFLNDVFSFFRTNDENLQRTYDLALTTNKHIDWDKFYMRVIQDAESRYLPVPKWFIAKMLECEVIEPGTYKINGGTGVLKLVVRDKQTGKVIKRPTYEYEMSNCPWSIPEIKAKFKAKYKDSFDDFVYYSPQYKVIGNTVLDMREEENVC